MNSDPHETAAWRAFGMLDADEAGAFDEAVRRDPELRSLVQEMSELSAAVAVVSSVPVKPRTEELDRLRARLGFPGHRRSRWLAWSGWAAAAVLAVLLMVQRSPEPQRSPLAGSSAALFSKAPRAFEPEDETSEAEEAQAISPLEPSAPAVTDAAGQGRVETKRLIQEIEVLRGQLANFQKRDRERFSPIPGVAWPIVMTMRPPGTRLEEDPAMTSLNGVLGDALAGRAPLLAGGADVAGTAVDGELSAGIVTGEGQAFPELLVPMPTAIPIYDSARDAGTLVVSNLPALEANEAYNLWVRTSEAANPIYVGRLPQTVAAGADSLDFSLGSSGIVPSGFILTKGADGTLVQPGHDNTILQGP